ncbi:sulfatase family protein [Planctomicrobium sp. SH664]|uniref:sulfatase family protein n=1 Tax=Planctomicrobium sp. SH664 TaxID=3448125 RepID=UPI003F5BB777
MKRFIFSLLAAVCCLSAFFSNSTSAADRKPNVLLILCDDTGWGEFGFQGATDIPTPHIDSIAANGVKFTQGYVSCPVCSPSRAGLMTGRYQTRFGHENNAGMKRLGLDVKEKTIANRMKGLGYATAAFGKWHLGELPKYHPLKRGFDEFYGALANTSYYHPALFVDSRKSPDVIEIQDDLFYTTEQFGIRTAEWIEEHGDTPWFVYLTFNAQHNPLQAPQAYLDRFPHIGDEKRRTFAAMMSAMDDAVGKALSKIRELNQEEQTLIIFLSDNGGPSKSTTSSNLPLRGLKAMVWEGGVRIPFCMQWKGHLPAGETFAKPVIQLDLLPTIIAAAGGTVDPEWKLDGVNLLPYLTGKNPGLPHETLFWRYGDQWAIRHGDDKLVVGEGGSGRPELYDLVDDKEETRDLAPQHPEKVKKLQELYDAWNSEQAPPNAEMAPKVQPAKSGKKKLKKARNN